MKSWIWCILGNQSDDVRESVSLSFIPSERQTVTKRQTIGNGTNRHCTIAHGTTEEHTEHGRYWPPVGREQDETFKGTFPEGPQSLVEY